MSINSKLIALIILFTFLVGCKAESPKTSSSDNSSSTSTDSGTGTTSYVGKWVNSNNTFGLDWKSNSFIYICTRINNVTFAGQGSYSSSNTRLTWWDGSYDSVTSSGSNIILTSTTYSQAVLYATCNPFGLIVQVRTHTIQMPQKLWATGNLYLHIMEQLTLNIIR